MRASRDRHEIDARLASWYARCWWKMQWDAVDAGQRRRLASQERWKSPPSPRWRSGLRCQGDESAHDRVKTPAKQVAPRRRQQEEMKDCGRWLYISTRENGEDKMQIV